MVSNSIQHSVAVFSSSAKAQVNINHYLHFLMDAEHEDIEISVKNQIMLWFDSLLFEVPQQFKRKTKVLFIMFESAIYVIRPKK